MELYFFRKKLVNAFMPLVLTFARVRGVSAFLGFLIDCVNEQLLPVLK